MLVTSSSCHPHHGSGHNSQCSLQLPQQVFAHHHDVKQREYNANSHINSIKSSISLFMIFFHCSLWRSKEVCLRSSKRTTSSRCRTVVSEWSMQCKKKKKPKKGLINQHFLYFFLFCFFGLPLNLVV